MKINKDNPFWLFPGSKSLVLAAGVTLMGMVCMGCGPSHHFISKEVRKPKRVAILPFQESQSNVQKDGGAAVSERMVTALAALEHYTVVERSQVERILKEQGFSTSGLVDQATAKRLGDLLGADALLLGHVSEYGKIDVSWGTKNMPWSIFVGLATSGVGFLTFVRPIIGDQDFAVSFSARLVSASNGEVIFSNDVRVQRDPLTEAVSEACQTVLKPLH